MNFEELDIGDIFMKIYEDNLIYMKIPTCEREDKIFNAVGMKISRIFNEERWYNCLDLECGELYYIPEHEKVCIYTQLCIKNHKY